MPAAKVEFNYRDESLDGVFYGRNMEEHLGMAHEAVDAVRLCDAQDGCETLTWLCARACCAARG